MPLYEYHCTACAHRFERIVKFSDPVLRTCPKCGKDTVQQVISAPAVQFKGSGWYVTDYARKSSSAALSSAGKSEAETAAPSNGNGSAKKAATPAPAASASSSSNTSTSTGASK